MKFERYGSYKDSEIDGLGEIPSEWELSRLKDVFLMSRGRFSHRPRNDPQMYGGIYPFLQTGDVAQSNKFIESYTQTLSDKGIQVSREFKKNTILMTIAANIGDIGVLNFNAYFPDSIIGFKNKFLLDNNFAFYYLYVLKHSLNKIKITNTQDNLNLERLNTIFKALPHKSIQNKLANYLDIQTSKIDQELSILEQKIEKYKELKQTLIAHTVLRGLNKNVELKSSETEWIGDIPKHWNTDRLKNIFNERVGKNLDVKTGEAVTSNILSVMKDIGVINHRDKGNVGNKMSEDITNYKLVYPNDIVVNKMNVMIGSVGISKEFGALSVIYIILITKKDSHSKYYDYFFKMKAFQRSLRRIATGILEIREAVNMTLFMQEMMTKPPYDEQVAIANYLDEKTSKIDSIVEAIGKKIEVLKEFRKTLINDVVMGKVKVA